MKIQILDTIEEFSYVTKSIQKAMEKAGHTCEVTKYDRPETDPFAFRKEAFSGSVSEATEAVVTLNFYPEVSDFCEKNHLLYLAWVYQFPCIDLYSVSVLNSCNRIFLPDPDLAELFAHNGIPNIFYLPYAVDPDGYEAVGERINYVYEVTTTGTQYLGERQKALEILGPCMDRTKGYIDGVVEAQRCVFGADFIEDQLPGYIAEDIYNSVPIPELPGYVAEKSWICSQYLLLPILTRVELVLMNYLGAKHGGLHVFSKDESIDYGEVHPYPERKEFAKVIAQSKVNLIFQSRMEHGIVPLKLLETMAAGGFVITRITRGIAELFEHEKDLAMFDHRQGIEDTVKYYLEHEEERKKIAEAGRKLVLAEHTYDIRMAQMMEVL